jgi:DNA-binding IclR family transcriptional regulator
MTAYLAGLAILRCAAHERADDIDPAMRLTLAAMGSFAGNEATPECYAARQSIATRAGLSVRTVHRALSRLEDMGLITPDGRRGKTIRWRLVSLVGHDGAESS